MIQNIEGKITKMKNNNTREFSYKLCDLDRIVDEKGSVFIALRKIAWGCGKDDNPEDLDIPVKLDLRKYYNTDQGERMDKGVSFLTEEGPNELTKVLLEEGYGNTAQCLSVLLKRSDIKDAVNTITNGDTEEEGYYDPRELLKIG